MIRVGVWTFGLTLCILGGALLWGNLSGAALGLDLAAWWGAIPLLFGLELLVSHFIAAARTGDPPPRVGIHGGSLTGLIVIMVVGLAANAAANFGFPWAWDLTVGDLQIGQYRHRSEVDFSADTELPPDITAVRIELPPGEWTIAGADTDRVLVEGGLEVRARTAERAETAARGTDVVLTPDGSILYIALDIPGYPADGPKEVQIRSEAVITLPRALATAVTARVGDVTISGLAADLSVTAAVGDVAVRGITGDVEVRVSTGDVRVEDVAGAADIESATGGIEVARVAGEVRVSGQTGRVRVSDPGAAVYIDVTTGSCTIESSAPVAGRWSVEATTGSITVSLPRASDVDIQAGATLGSISSNLGLSIQSGIGQKSASGTLGAGTHAIRLEATTGSITINGTD